MDILRIIVFFAFVIVLTVLWRKWKHSRLPENYKDMCICEHARTAHISYTNFRNLILGKCSECECPEFIQSKETGDVSYLLREEGPIHQVLWFVGRSIAMVLVAFLPRQTLHNLACRIENWLDEQKKKAKEEEDDESPTEP